MIRIGLPSPLFFKLRLRAQIASNHIARQSNELKRNCSERLHQCGTANSLKSSAFLNIFSSRKKLSNQMRILTELTANHQDLVDLLCNAAKAGLRKEDFPRYVRLREWFVRNYSSQCRPVINQSMAKKGSTNVLDNENDPFAMLFMHPTIIEAIHSFEVLEAIVQSRDILDVINSAHKIN